MLKLPYTLPNLTVKNQWEKNPALFNCLLSLITFHQINEEERKYNLNSWLNINKSSMESELWVKANTFYFNALYIKGFCCCSVLFLNHTWQCSVVTLGYILRNHFWLCLQKNLECWALKPGQLHARQCPSHLSCPYKTIFLTEEHKNYQLSIISNIFCALKIVFLVWAGVMAQW